MHIIFNKNVRVYERRNSLSKLPLVIDDDVNPIDNVEISYESDKIQVSKTEVQPTEIAPDAEFLYIGDAIGLYGDSTILSAIELILCDNAIAVKLIRGSFTICPEPDKPETVLKVFTGVSDTANAYVNELKWLNSSSFVQYCSYFGDLTKQFTYDYMYQLQLKGTGGKVARVDVVKQGIVDISMGKIAVILKRREDLARQKEIKKNMEYFSNDNSSSVKYDSYDDSAENSTFYDEDEEFVY